MRLLLFISLFCLTHSLSQEVQFKSHEVIINDESYDIFPLEEIFVVNLTDSCFVYTLIKDGMMLYSMKQKINEYSIDNGMVNFKTKVFDFELHINYQESCLIFDVDDPCLKWLGTCSIDFNTMLRE